MNTRALTAALITLALAACTSAPTNTPTPDPTSTMAPTATPAPTLTPTPTGSHRTTPPWVGTPTPPPTATPLPTATSTVAPTATPSATPTAVPSPTPTPTASPTPVEWGTADRIARGAFSEPVVAVDARGAIHVVVTGTGGGNQGIWYLTNASGTWVNQQAVAPWISEDYGEIGRVDEPAIAIDSNDGSVWIAFTYWECGGECYPNWPNGIFLVNNAGGTWSEPVQLAGDGLERSALAVRDGHIYFACAGSSDYTHRYGEILFGTDVSGAWSGQLVAQKGAFPHLLLNTEGKVGILFGGSDLRYARQKPDGSFATEHLTGGASLFYSALATDAVSGATWAAWSVPTDDQGNYDVLVAARGSNGFADPAVVVTGGDVIGFGVHDGVVQLIAAKSGITFVSNASGTFVEQVISPTQAYWGTAAFALGPNGRPLVVYTHDADTGGQFGVWFLKGPAV